MKDYLLRLLTECAPDNGFAQDAIEHALLTGLIHCPGADFQADVQTVMNNYDRIIEAYHIEQQRNTLALVDSYAPLLEQIAAPFPLAA